MGNDLLNKIRDLYNLPDINSFTKIEKGFLSENHQLSTQDKSYFLKKYRFTDEVRIKEIHRAKSFFREDGIPVIMPISIDGHSTYFEHNGSYFALFPFVDGLQPERGNLSKRNIISLGKMLGNIHLRGKDSNIEVNDYFKGWIKEVSLEIVQKLEKELAQIENKTEFDLLAQETIAFKKKLIEENDVSFKDLDLRNDHLVHGDYLDQNVFFDERGEIIYVFDFEKTSYEPRTQELFRSGTYSFLNTGFDESAVRALRLYLQSYLEVYPADEKELKNGLSAHYLKSIHSFWVETEHYLKNNTRVDIFLEPNFRRLTFMSERLNELLNFKV